LDKLTLTLGGFAHYIEQIGKRLYPGSCQITAIDGGKKADEDFCSMEG